MSDGGYKKNVGLVGGVSLLITSITGPGIVLIPLVFQQAGWFLPILLFFIIGGLAALSALFVIESVNRFPGNEEFEVLKSWTVISICPLLIRNVEFTVMVHQFFGRRIYYVFLFILYGSLQSTNVASIIGAAQIFDSLLVGMFGGSCGWGIAPISGLYCVHETVNENSPFGSNTMFCTLGLLLVFVIILPLTQIDLNDNMFLQFISLVYNGIFLVTLVGIVGSKKSADLISIPAFGNNLSQIVGQIMFNYTLANTVPSWINVKHPQVDAKKCVWYCTTITLVLYIMVGILGGISYPQSSGTNILQAIYSDETLSGGAHVWVAFIYILFPILTYLTSIPVAMIVVRINFLAARITSYDAANWWAVYFPFILAIPLQTGSYITYFGTYTSISFQAMCNFLAPFLIFLFLNKRKLDMAQSVLDELEFLDISAGVKKGYTDDDSFDYIYHLPTANPDQIIWRDPFKTFTMPTKKESSMAASISKLSHSSRHSIREIKSILDPSLGAPVKSLRNTQLSNRLTGTGDSIRSSKLGHSLTKNSSHKGSLRHGSNMQSQFSMNSVGIANSSNLTDSRGQDVGEDPIGLEDQDLLITMRDGGALFFRALPAKWYQYIHPNSVAQICLVIICLFVLQVIFSNFTST